MNLPLYLVYALCKEDEIEVDTKLLVTDCFARSSTKHCGGNFYQFQRGTQLPSPIHEPRPVHADVRDRGRGDTPGWRRQQWSGAHQKNTGKREIAGAGRKEQRSR
jgi:hypothetical protein